MSKYTKICVIPDCQVKGGVPLDHLTWAGNYIAEKRPEIIVNIGDFSDMPSLSSYDKGKKSFEGRRYNQDVEVSKQAMKMLLAPIKRIRSYKPRMILTLGNHEERINRAINDDSRLDGTIGIQDLCYHHDWKVYQYLKPVMVEGVCFCHYFTSGTKGLAVSSARALLNKKHMSCVMGHNQKRDIDVQYDALGKRLTALFVGAFYQHDEEYLTPQGNAETWRGIWFLNEVHNGEYDEMPISLEYLRRRYA